ncbi:unnamed protein product [Closterium sp. NIES-64]|nr:unnamed protein product [Closterium sp. NIES-64]
MAPSPTHQPRGSSFTLQPSLRESSPSHARRPSLQSMPVQVSSSQQESLPRCQVSTSQWLLTQQEGYILSSTGDNSFTAERVKPTPQMCKPGSSSGGEQQECKWQ